MQRCWKLLRLNLSNNAIGDVGVGQLCRPLKDIRSLQVLRLRGNRIGDEGAARLAELLGGRTPACRSSSWAATASALLARPRWRSSAALWLLWRSG